MIKSTRPTKPKKSLVTEDNIDLEGLIKNTQKDNLYYEGVPSDNIIDGENISRLCSGLPYPLTDEQYEIGKNIIEWIRSDACRVKAYSETASFKRLSGYAGCISEDSIIVTNRGDITLRQIILMQRSDLDFLGFNKFDHDLKVLSHDGTWNNITDIYATADNTSGYRITFSSGKVLECSWKHPLRVKHEDGYSHWILAKFLSPDMRVNSYVDGQFKLDSIVKIEGIFKKFYDLTVKDKESFISNTIVSHNTGKSAVISWLITEGINHFPKHTRDRSIAVCSFTWKAALVLKKRGIHDACSIHSIFYEVKGLDEGTPYFVKRTKEDVSSMFSLIIVDEASMVGSSMRDDIEYFGVPVLYVGDAGQ